MNSVLFKVIGTILFCGVIFLHMQLNTNDQNENISDIGLQELSRIAFADGVECTCTDYWFADDDCQSNGAGEDTCHTGSELCYLANDNC